MSPAATPLPALDTAPLALVVDLVRSGRARTRRDLVALSGLPRKAVAQRVDQALELGLLEHGDLAPSEGGRQARTLRFHAGAGHVYGVLMGASEITAAVLDLSGTVLDSEHLDWSVETGPEPTMKQVDGLLETLAERTGADTPWAIGVGLPGPVEFATGKLVAPPIMPGWDGFSARSWLRDHHDAPVWVDNDTNLMALGEWSRGTPHDGRDMLYIKVGTGIGAGLVTHGRLLRGEHGAAGDIGHIRVTDDPGTVCRCGRTGCLEAVVGGWALLREATARAAEGPAFAAALRDHGELKGADLGNAVLAGDPLALELLDRSATVLAGVTANLLNFCNPGTLVLGGGVLKTGPRFLERLRDTVFERCTDLVCRDLTVRAASLTEHGGVIGAGLLAAGNLLTLPALTRWVDRGSPLGQAALLQRFSAEIV
ncbi:ROK family protein [Amycolatopsis sacchari]|uniref:Sugar kinase of the NBD/HSP70 family, may contain an N-terminal HTH domain n=1 Tax=Amycolatopsis sacchari TaxID=115433 RepID=A0A1I3UM32_9PSEU|nr:ROK family protein [Amycolatopsis sacchari]SFJ84130.1 Sugar kinase of the NBD/HSP70 family, may contain an N-terminal HTH domain [Amycolatopsis sacchari]